MDENEALAEEAARWEAYAEPLGRLCALLCEEFARQTPNATALPLAIHRCTTGTFALVLTPGQSQPRLLEYVEGAPAPGRCIVDFAREAGPAAAGGTAEFILGDVVLDPRGRYLAYTVDTSGADTFEVRLRTLPAGESVTVAESAAPSLAWDSGPDRVVHLRVDGQLRPVELRATDPRSGDTVRLAALAPGGDYVELATSSDGTEVLAAIEQHSRRSMWVLDRATGGLSPLREPRPGERVYADVRQGRCVMAVSGAADGDAVLLAASLDDLPVPDESWAVVCRASDGATFEDVALDGDRVLVLERRAGRRLLRCPLPGVRGAQECVGFTADRGPRDGGSPASGIRFVAGLRPAGAPLELVRSCWDQEARWYRLATGATVARPFPGAGPAAAAAVTGGPGITVLETAVASADGVLVPLTVLRPAAAVGPLPTVLYAYGSYGIPVDPDYSLFRPSLFRRGVSFAIAHVRGGGELGPAWHEAGRGAGKLSAVQDYLGCARHLIAQGLTAPGSLAARARSAGAALVGAAVNQEPGLFAAAVLEVPFVDCLQTLLRADDPLTELEWDEWGNPLADPRARAVLAALAPVDNVRPAAYPAMLLTGGLSDTRVAVAEPLRLASAVRTASTAGRPVLVRVNGVGHLGHSEVAEDWQDEAAVLAFVLTELGKDDA
ncbi:prolyl oligopeptidase family serine peptidase [Kitasatospora sp. NPDC059599]|uniref:prolyl oligopeptidase family serine peptidase n=1 Tax=Kitasatospora sp. NPDC059599 TaxID=3346880 RepID=UPI0036C8D9FE